MSETTNLKLKKHDNPETNTEKFDIENYLNGNWDKIDKNVGEVNIDISNINSKNKEQDTNIEQLQENTKTSSNKITELEKELKEAQEDFYQNSIRGQASGEYIHVEDSSNCRAKIGIGGNHEQETREGYQLLNLQPGMQNGITYYVDDEGYFCISGTCTSDRITLKLNEMVLNGTYTFTNKSISGGGINCALKDNTSEYKTIFWANNNNNTKEVNVISKDLVCYLTNGATYNSKIKLMLVSGSQEKDIEQYGASPSPDYRSKVVAVGSNVNELENTAKTQTIKDVTFTVNEDGTVVANGTASQQVTLVLTKVLSLQKGDYMISGCPRGGTTSTYRIDVWKSDWSSLGFEVGNGTKISLSESIENAIVGITITKGTTVENMVFKPKIEKGKVATPWSPYGQGCVKVIKCNKQLFDKNKALQKYEISGITGNVSANDLYFVTDYIRVNANEQYYLSGKLTGNSNCFYDKNKKFISTVNLENGLLTVPNNPNIYYLRFNSRLTAIDTTMLEKNTKKSAYEEHQEQSYIMPIQQEMLADDYIDGVEYHTWKKIILTGNEPVYIDDVYHGITQFTIPLPVGGLSIKDDTVRILSNYFKGVGWNNSWTIDNSVTIIDLNDFRIMTSQYATVEDFKAWLKSKYDAGTPIMIYYKLQTPTRLAFTDEQKAVAKELNNARTYKNVTNITTDSKAILSLDYVKDQETQNQKMQNEIDEIKQLLSTTQTSAMLLDNLQKEVESEVE